eukprot:CAMPEP_0198132948 /NCGR_PEP_ID=MMETSP1442-20131203/59310_1 /TAXON_ID= /ORGANISM="Craspedostauros australis, Strain CCMP3328" /LENGTH=310 /DNA_ID=CAMNT_0043794051 /DNA_START=54 /DNA_END=986 /DNA_ORIENTATION=+
MSAGPFRSHLLQQWARSNQSRPPVAVVPWLRKPVAATKPASRYESGHEASSAHGATLPSISSIDTTPTDGSRRSYHALPSVADDLRSRELGETLTLSLLFKRRRLQFKELLRDVVREATQAESSSLLYPMLSFDSVPFQLKSLVAPSSTIHSMIEIMRIMKSRRQGVGTGVASDDGSNDDDELEQWKRIPAFLVAIMPQQRQQQRRQQRQGEFTSAVMHAETQQNDSLHNRSSDSIRSMASCPQGLLGTMESDDEHTPSSRPQPSSQNEMNKFAATIAAMQSIMCRLRNDHNISSQWSTHSVINQVHRTK